MFNIFSHWERGKYKLYEIAPFAAGMANTGKMVYMIWLLHLEVFTQTK